MTITSSGVKCDVCGNYVLPIIGDETYNPFRLKHIKKDLHACDKCIVIIKDLDTGLGGSGDWTKLPDGPLRKVFEEFHEEPDPEAIEKRFGING
jgi:hypothetical protein